MHLSMSRCQMTGGYPRKFRANYDINPWKFIIESDSIIFLILI